MFNKHMSSYEHLFQNPDIVLVHYLNVPYPDNTKVKIPMMPSCTLEKKEWTKEDLVDQLKPMCMYNYVSMKVLGV